MGELSDIQRSLGNIECKMDSIHEQLPAINKRVGSLETTRTYGLGALGAFTVLSGLVWRYFK